MRAHCVLLFLLLTATTHAQVRMPATTRADIARLRAIAMHECDPIKLVQRTRAVFPTALVQGRCMVGFMGKVGGTATPPSDEHMIIGSRIGDIVTFRVDAHHLERVHQLAGLTYVELAGVMRTTLDNVIKDTRADSVQLGINLPQSFTGRDVIIGIADFGLEYAHPMFYDTALTGSRILAAWDMNKQSGPAPSGYTYGTLHGSPAEVLAAVVDTAEAAGLRDTHGTHVTGIAAGGGAGTPYRGPAFDADLLLVTMFHDFTSPVDAINWMHEVAQAEGKRLVVNMSWGGIPEFADGTSLFAQALDLFVDQGVVLIASVGNFGDGDFHLQHDFTSDTLRTRVRSTDPSLDPTISGQRLMLWGEAGEAFSASLTIRNNANAVLAQVPWAHTDATLPFTDSVFVVGADSVHVLLVAEAAHPGNGRPYLRMDVSKSNMALRVDLSVAAVTGTVHAWNGLWWIEYGWFLEGFQAGMAGYVAGDDQFGVGEPACAVKVIAVGGYRAAYQITSGNWAGGTGYINSSRGPTLDGRLKPEICAPGVSVISSINGYNTVGVQPASSVSFLGESYGFQYGTGTSMAAPVVTGIAALLLEAMPFATPAEIKQAIMDNARTDQHTGVIPAGGSTT